MLNYLMSTPHMPLTIAAEMTGLPAELLRRLIRSGVLRGEAPYRVKEMAGWCDIEQALEIAQRIRQARVPVEGRGISVLEASAKYGIPNPTLYRWQQRGTVRTVGRSEDGVLLLDEGDVAMARVLTDLVGKGRAFL